MALTTTELEALTRDYWDKGSWDQYFLGNILMYRLLKKGNKYTGGKKIRTILDYGEPHGGDFNAQSTFDTNKYEEHTAAFYTPAYYYEPVTYDIDDIVQNTGPEQEVDVVNAKLTKAQKKIRSKMADDLYGSSSYGASGRKILGLPAMCSTTSTYGEIAVADMSEWAAGAVTSTTEPISFGVMRTLRTACTVGDGPEDEATIFVTTRTIMDAVKGMTLPMQRFENVELAQVGFKNIIFEGTPVVADYKCTSGYLYNLNENYLDFKSHVDFFFKRQPWMRPTDKPLWSCQLFWVGQLVCKRRKAQGSHYNLTT